MDPPSSSPLSQQNDATRTDDSSITNLISQPFPSFDHRSTIAQPFDNEAKRDAEFQKKLSSMLLELMLDFHAWSSARPTQESERVADILEKDINGIIETETEQGMSTIYEFLSLFIEKTRQRLNDFVERIKLALAALTGLASG